MHVPDQDGMSIERRVAKDKAVSGDKTPPRLETDRSDNPSGGSSARAI